MERIVGGVAVPVIEKNTRVANGRDSSRGDLEADRCRTAFRGVVAGGDHVNEPSTGIGEAHGIELPAARGDEAIARAVGHSPRRCAAKVDRHLPVASEILVQHAGGAETRERHLPGCNPAEDQAIVLPDDQALRVSSPPNPAEAKPRCALPPNVVSSWPVGLKRATSKTCDNPAMVAPAKPDTTIFAPPTTVTPVASASFKPVNENVRLPSPSKRSSRSPLDFSRAMANCS